MPTRLVAPVAAGVLVLVAFAGAVVLASGDGPHALTVDDRTISQDAIDDQLSVLADHPSFAAGIVQQQIVPLPGSLSANAAAGWLTFNVLTDVAARELERRGGRITADDRDATGLERAPEFADLPADFRAEVVDRFGAVRALQRVLRDEAPDELADQVRQSCPSQRFVSHILVGSLLEAQAVQRELASGEPFEALARSISIDSGSAPTGGALGCLDNPDFATYPDAFREAAASAALDQVSDPVQTDAGFSVLLVTDEPSADELDAAALGQLATLARNAHVDVDPRYGRWDSGTAQVVPPGTRGG
jgi:parvulin-like peptidyl-prolyl isomerase